MELPSAIEKRLKVNSGCDTKRSLYTKGNSDTEDNRSLSPVAQHCITNASIQIAPAPPLHLSSDEDYEHIPIVPPPPMCLRYSRNLRRSQLQPHDNVEEGEQDENVAPEQSRNSNTKIIEDIQIMPPSPESLQRSRQLRSSSLDDSMSQEQMADADGDVIKETMSIVSPPPDATQLTRRSRKFLAPPLEDIIEDDAAADRTQRSQTGIEDIRIVPPSPISIRYSQRLQSSTLKHSEDVIEQEKRDIAAQHSQSSPAEIVENLRIAPSPDVSVEHLTRSKQQEIIYLDVEQEQKEKDPQGYLPAVTELDDMMLPLIQDNGSSYMEELRVQTPTPPSSLSQISMNEQMMLDEQPSTSKAAREALQLSISRQQKIKNPKKVKQKKNTADDAVFKKPILPAPRAGKHKSFRIRELESLRIKTGDQTLASQYSDNADKSKTDE